jgi:hypothetical protein
MRFSRHAKNRMRGAGFTRDAVEAMAADPDGWRMDELGNPVAVGWIRSVPVEIVIALDDPGFVITVIARRKMR